MFVCASVISVSDNMSAFQRKRPLCFDFWQLSHAGPVAMSAGRKKINLEINNYPPKFAGRKMLGFFFLLLVSDFEVLKEPCAFACLTFLMRSCSARNLSLLIINMLNVSY